ncbi:hypothetical protein [Opitutus sp. ER46]|uniref:hypothetical protein n=1 Tax=Opitutus sp. ER46 TaxID=2161864 RepID=UPI0018EE705D|nr:hypothetical protein [Opitutus sp. ER46]
MEIWSSPGNIKIIGTEGHSPETLRQEIERGGRFVIYSYNFSFVVMSFKRATAIYFLPPGQNSILKGLPFTLISLLLGWWGVPWGIIYTIQSLHQNLTGGRDVTPEVEAALARLAPGAKPADMETATSAGQRAAVAPARRRARWSELIPVAGVVALVAGVVYLVACAFSGNTLRVAVVSGLPEPYVVTLNGTEYPLKPGVPKLIEASAGEFTLRGAPGRNGVETFDARLGFFSRPFDRRVLIVNPDRAAILYTEQVTYYPDTAVAAKEAPRPVTLHANRLWYHLPRPEFFFEKPPKTVSMSSRSGVVRKAQIAQWIEPNLASRQSALSAYLGDAAGQEYIGNYVRLQPNDDLALRLLVALLPPADARRVLESRLSDRPVLVEWHRTYQFVMDRSFPDFDLTAQYHSALQAEPGDGAMMYLYGRLLLDPAAARPFYERALRAKVPCAYATYALATDLMGQGRYADALPLLEQAAKDGVGGGAIELRRRDALLALGRFDELQSNAHARAVAQPDDAGAFLDELVLSQTRTPNRAAGERAIASFIAAFRARHAGEDGEMLNYYLSAQLAYVLGDEVTAAALLRRVKTAQAEFEAAVDRRSHTDAATAAAKIKGAESQHRLIMMLAAQAAGDGQGAETHFQQALEAMAKEDQYGRRLAQGCRGTAPVDHDAILQTPMFSDELRVLFTALGVRYPEQRERYFSRARELDRSPTFPHLLLQAVRGERKPDLKT